MSDDTGFPMMPSPLLDDDDDYRAHRAVRLLRAKAAELENRYAKGAADSYADIALIATLLADFMERTERKS
jgi:hypothetical protein